MFQLSWKGERRRLPTLMNQCLTNKNPVAQHPAKLWVQQPYDCPQDHPDALRYLGKSLNTKNKKELVQNLGATDLSTDLFLLYR